MPIPIPDFIGGVPTATIRQALPDVSRFTLSDHDWGTFILACDYADQPEDSLGDNLRHKYALDRGDVKRDDMVQLMANLDWFSQQDRLDADDPAAHSPEEMREHRESAERWVSDFIDAYVHAPA